MTRIATLTLALLLGAAAAAVGAQENGAGTAKGATLKVVDNPEREASRTLHSEVDEYYLFSKRDCADMAARKYQLGRGVENAIDAGRPVYLYGQSVTTSLFINKSVCAAMAKFIPEPGHKYEAHHRWGDDRSNVGCTILVVDKATGAPPPALENVPLVGECEAVRTWTGG